MAADHPDLLAQVERLDISGWIEEDETSGGLDGECAEAGVQSSEPGLGSPPT